MVRTLGSSEICKINPSIYKSLLFRFRCEHQLMSVISSSQQNKKREEQNYTNNTISVDSLQLLDTRVIIAAAFCRRAVITNGCCQYGLWQRIWWAVAESKIATSHYSSWSKSVEFKNYSDVWTLLEKNLFTTAEKVANLKICNTWSSEIYTLTQLNQYNKYMNMYMKWSDM